ncbi:MAG: RNA methyltransferase [Candidatus Latescibacteria bacterium]|nr:RNA methyltransferase [Candidatus Latescibacterota bacterium]
MDTQLKAAVVGHLGGFLGAERRARIEEVLAQRTRRLTVVLEDIFQPHNASAVLRSCECFGLQDVHIVEERYRYRVNPEVAMGAGHWLDIHRYRDPAGHNTGRCLEVLQGAGYTLVAATPNEYDCLLDELRLQGRMAVLLGTEEEGLSEQALRAAQVRVKIPMYGFTRSFNLSVSAALILRELSRQLRAGAPDWGLSEAEKLELRLKWYRRDLRGSDLIEERFIRSGQ